MRKIVGTKMFSDGAERTVMMLWRRDRRLSGSAFQILVAATRKARLPTVESLNGGTTRWLVPEEWSECRPDTSATRLSGPSVYVKYSMFSY